MGIEDGALITCNRKRLHFINESKKIMKIRVAPCGELGKNIQMNTITLTCGGVKTPQYIMDLHPNEAVEIITVRVFPKLNTRLGLEKH
jgi:hypothetical protein